MNIEDRLRLLRDHLPAGGSVTFTRADLSELLGEAEPVSTGVDKPGDLTVEEIAVELKRSPNRVRDFIRSGALKAYTFGREYRCTRAALEAFMDAQREGKREPAAPGKRADLGGWRKVRPAA